MTTKQSHIIKRQILEIKGLRKEDAPQMQEQWRRHYYHIMLPIIDRFLSRWSAGGRVIQIDRLELDLGLLKVQSVEEGIRKELGRQLNQQLNRLHVKEEASTGHSPVHTAENSSPWDLFSYFVQTGSLPWWTDTTSSEALLDSLEHLLEKEGHRLMKAMSRWVLQKDASRRLARQLPLEMLVRLISLPDGMNRDVIAYFFNLTHQMANLLRLPVYRFREEATLKMLRLTYGGRPARLTSSAFWPTFLSELSYAFNIQLHLLSEVLDESIEKLPSNFTVKSELKQAAAAITTPSRPEDVDQGSNPRTAALTWTILLSRQQLNDHQYGRLQQILVKWKIRPSSSDAIDRLLQLLNRRGLLPKMRMALDDLELGAIVEEDKNDQIEALLDQLEVITSTDHQAASVEEEEDIPNFDQSAELFTNNAGLVILWPYLERYFGSLGLVKEGQFIDIPAAHRAAGLLQHLVDGQSQPLEYLAGFNKILCGLAWNTVLDFGAPVTEEEKEECLHLLQAVISSVPILKDMSTEGFRGSFLSRKGMIRALPGMWELHVEKETYDIVLDKFPWSWNIVKLPWLDRLIAVQW